MKTLLSLLILTFSLTGYSQKPLQLFPTTIELTLNEADAQAFQQNVKKHDAILQKLKEGVKLADLTKAEQELWENYDETMENYWDIIGGGCSWYCGGGPKRVTASSYLSTQASNKYEPGNAHDLNYKTAWVEGVSGHGIGEYLLYHFSIYSPRITEIHIVNGYVKSKEAWENNARVKTLNMYIDDTLYAVLHLEDKRATNSFTVEPIGHPDRQDQTKWEGAADWTIKFEIAAVYPGKKYEDVVISEIYFDGLDVHCFAAGTAITMADGTYKKIEDLSTGEAVISFNEAAQRFEPATILELANPIHENLVEISFSDGTAMTCTQDHPIRTVNGTWKSLDPEKTAFAYQFEEVKRLEVGDLLMVKGKRAGKTIETIHYLDNIQQTYTIVKLDRNQSFVANGVVVGTEELRQPILSVQHK